MAKTKFAIKVGKQIRRERIRAHLYQRELAKFTGLSVAAISMFEGGHSVPMLETYIRLGEYLDLRSEELCDSRTD